MSYTLNVERNIVDAAERCAVRRGVSLGDMLRAYMIVVIQDDSAQKYIAADRGRRRGMRLGLAKGKYRLPTDEEDRAMDLEIQKMFEESSRHGVAVAELPDIHGDPFDRMLIAQARADGLTLITHDDTIAKYGDSVLKV